MCETSLPKDMGANKKAVRGKIPIPPFCLALWKVAGTVPNRNFQRGNL